MLQDQLPLDAPQFMLLLTDKRQLPQLSPYSQAVKPDHAAIASASAALREALPLLAPWWKWSTMQTLPPIRICACSPSIPMPCARAASVDRANPQAKAAATYGEVFMVFPDESHSAFRHLGQNA
jgi:hypothetical protein